MTKHDIFIGGVMKGRTWKVTADHSILRRPDKYGLTEDEADELVTELKRLGYENINKTSL